MTDDDFPIDDASLDADLPLDANDLGIDFDEFADELAAARSEPIAAPEAFDAGPDLHALDGLTLVGRIGVLERLGPAHFRSKGFSFMGFLQTVYEHVAHEMKPSEAAEKTPAAEASGPAGTPVLSPLPVLPGES